MTDYLKARLGERSTRAGFAAIALALALLVVPFIASGDAAATASDNIKWLIGVLFIGGIGGVLFPENKA